MIPFGELSRFKAPIGGSSAQKRDIAVFLEKKCAISRFVLMLDKLINLEKGSLSLTAIEYTLQILAQSFL